MDEAHQNGAGGSNSAGLGANQDVPQMPPLPISGPMPEGLLSSPGLTPGLSPGLTPGVATIATPTPSHELQPLGQSSAKNLDAATWAGQSLVVAVVLGGVALVAYAIKRRHLAKGGGLAAREGARMDRAIDLETVDEDRTEHAAPARFGYAGMGGGMGDALRDEIATLRAEIESARDEAAQLRREVASLRTMMERGGERGNERGAPLRDGRSHSSGNAGMYAADAAARGEASHSTEHAHAEPKPAMRESVEQRVLALAARGETAIAIAQRTGVPTGQVELMINLARASGRV